MKRGVKTLFLPPAIAMVIFAAIGLLLIFFPAFFVHILPPILGVVLILVGLQSILSGLALRSVVKNPGFAVGRGVVAIVVAIIFLAKNDLSVVFISILFGLFILVSAVLGIADALRKRKAGEPWLFDIFEGVVDIILAVILLISPLRGMNLWTQILGIHFILVAVGALLMLNRVRKQLMGMIPQEPKGEESGE